MRAALVLLLALLAVLSLQSNAFRAAVLPAQRMGKLPLRMQQAQDKSLMDKLASGLKSKILPAVLGAGLLLSSFPVENAEAARSGGRSGGSSFRMPAPSMRSSTSLRSSNSGYGGGRGVTVMPMMPMYSPFGYSPFGFSPFGFMPINLNVLVLGMAAYAVYTVLSNRAGGADFSNDGTTGALGGGATVMKIQLSLSSDWSQPGNIMETLTRLAEKNSAMSGRTDLSKLLSESVIALLRRQNEWKSAAFEGEQFTLGPQKAEPYFQRLAVQERAKFEEENSSSSVAVIKSSNSGRGAQPTEVVVSLVVAVRGQSTAYSRNVRSLAEVKKCLQGLAADSLSDEGENVMAVEVLWTPSEPGNVISEREIIEDYPEVRQLA